MTPLITLMVMIGTAWLTFLSVRVFNKFPIAIRGSLKVSWCLLGSASAWTLWVIIRTQSVEVNCLSWVVIGSALVLITDRRRT